MGFVIVNLMLAVIAAGAFWIAARPSAKPRKHEVEG